MNWYKTSQNFNEEIPEDDFTEDYDPSWDYEMDTILDKKTLAIVEETINEINTKILPKIGMGKAKIYYIKDEPGALARYVNGTAPYPVFVIDINNIKGAVEECSKDFNCDLEHELVIGIRTTLFHELGHAIQDWMNFDYDEDETEEFARHYQDFGKILNFWEQE